MAVAKTTVTIKEIQKVARQIVDKFHPRKVILFGSYADGKPDEDSDVDFLVVMETEEKSIHAAARISAAIDHDFAIDILVFKPSELEASLQRKGVFATEVMSKGIVLYEDRDKRVD
jgi:predicted nucleotidyltransferase